MISTTEISRGAVRRLGEREVFGVSEESGGLGRV